MESLKKLSEFFNSEEGKKSVTDFAQKIKREADIKTNQLERFNRRGNFVDFVEKVIVKYDSDKYRDGWYNRGIEPPEDLLWFLFYYAEKYGRECSIEEWDLYGTPFTSNLFFCNGYYFNRMDGQGSYIKVAKVLNTPIVSNHFIELTREDLVKFKTDLPIDKISIYDFKGTVLSRDEIDKADLITFKDGEQIKELKNKYRTW